ncbi:MAG TPA: GGDEF domain-containing protein [Usitatibacter sp.]|nr:GGDEF domain-containing protein [Usitatibacter sp.]
MVSKVQPGRALLERLSVYRLLGEIGPLRESYAGKFALAAFVGVFVPLGTFIAYLLYTRTDLEATYPMLAALVLASVAGFLGMMWVLNELLVPVDLTAQALRDYIERRQLPDLPTGFPDHAGRLMEGTQYTLTQLNETIDRLERTSDTDELTGLYNRRAGEKRLAEEVARAERDLESFQLAFFDINELKAINDQYGHASGDACISHVSALLETNTRRGDWVARWGGDEFVVGLHRSQALKLVVDRLLEAVGSTPVEVAVGVEVYLHMSCGVAVYRFGSGSAGLLADADHAMYAAKELSRRDGRSHVCYRTELDLPAATASAAGGRG